MATVYIIRAVGVSMIKVGITVDVGRRLSEIRSMCPVELEVVDLLEGVGFGVESTIHGLMYEYRSHGEWFREPALQIAVRWFDIVRQSAAGIAKMIGEKCDEAEIARIRQMLVESGSVNIALALDAYTAGAKAIADAFVNETGAGVPVMDRRFG